MPRHLLFPFLAAFLLATTLSACDSVLDAVPSDEVSREQAFSDRRGVNAVLLGAYSSLQLTGSYGGSAYMVADFTTENAGFGGSFQTFQQLQNYSTLSTNISVQEIYLDPYDGINRANDIIANAEDVAEADTTDGFESDEASQFVAEAEFVRALHYHNLVRYFALPWNISGSNDQLGVPLKLEPTVNPDEVPRSIPRSTVAQVYEQINADLEDAISRFEAVGGGTSVAGRADLGAAQALLARVRLYQGRYESASELAGQVIDSDAYSLVSDIVQAFGESNSSEDIFAVQNNENDNSGTNDFPSSFYLPSSLGGRGDITVTDTLLTVYDDADARQASLVYTIPDPLNPVRQFGLADATCADVNCWSHKYRSPTFADNIRVLRLAEMYLTRAEAEARLDGGDEEQALADLNTIRTRAGLPAFDAVADIGDGNDNDSEANEDGSLLSEIIIERRRELAFEGDYRHDLLRRGAPLSAGGTVAPEAQRILPIPAEYLDANPGLEQNPGY